MKQKIPTPLLIVLAVLVPILVAAAAFIALTRPMSQSSGPSGAAIAQGLRLADPSTDLGTAGEVQLESPADGAAFGLEPTAMPQDASDYPVVVVDGAPVLPPVDGDLERRLPVSEAIHADGDELMVVTGYLFLQADGSAVMSEGMAESLPPQPAGVTVSVEGFDLAEFDLASSQGVSWSLEPVGLFGAIDDGILHPPAD